MLKWLWLSGLIIALDQISKWLSEASLDYATPVAVMPSFNLTLVYNYGAAFSFLGDAGGWQRWFFSILALIVCGYILYWMRKLKETEILTAVSLALVLGGAIGNLIDRLAYGYVIDFLDFYFGRYHFATFNIADMGITIGAAILIFVSLFMSHEKDDKNKETKS